LVQRYKRAILSAAFTGNLRAPRSETEYKTVPFSDVIASTFYGPRIASNAYVKAGIPTLRTTDIGDWGQLILRDPQQVSVTDAEFAKWGLEDQDLLVTRTGATIGKCTLYNKEIGPALPSAYLIRVRLKLDLIIGKFALFYLLSPEGEDQLIAGRTAVAQPNINARAISAISIPLPKIETQQVIVQAIEAAFASIDRLASEAVNARKLIDHLDQGRSRQSVPRRAGAARPE
jgi:type I restriction enzyme, S subunit